MMKENLRRSRGNLIGSHIIGILWLGAVPIILLKHSVLKILTGGQMPGISSVFMYVLILVLIISIAFRQGENLKVKKQRSPDVINQLATTFVIRYFIIRVLFLFVYELWFRGFLLFDTISWIGMPEAVALNVFLYVLLHIFNSKKEMLACIPFGTLVCFLSISFNAAWPAIILHIGFSLVYEFNIYRSYLYSSKIIRL
jgi:membrane protease YdiL (CAAX protease family)